MCPVSPVSVSCIRTVMPVPPSSTVPANYCVVNWFPALTYWSFRYLCVHHDYQTCDQGCACFCVGRHRICFQSHAKCPERYFIITKLPVVWYLMNAFCWCISSWKTFAYKKSYCWPEDWRWGSCSGRRWPPLSFIYFLIHLFTYLFIHWSLLLFIHRWSVTSGHLALLYQGNRCHQSLNCRGKLPIGCILNKQRKNH